MKKKHHTKRKNYPVCDKCGELMVDGGAIWYCRDINCNGVAPKNERDKK